MGIAPTFNTVALQEQRFTGERSFEAGTVTFSNLNVVQEDSKKEKVTFTVAASLDRPSVLYVGELPLPVATEAENGAMEEGGGVDTEQVETDTNIQTQ